ncbi:hypothetical protein F383_28529 [Gossypium arboreum]|uniref:Uncharacterized protein n=1 Tax=Gossypium arboreum TaxID=29729 RepID=A0A0B0N7L1_GOSAR|nr:hypothetical protein F383_35086 [Gossypium arboreum]KHG23966.1 hypothetical protein F383_28529 [Gossypium arboreum]
MEGSCFRIFGGEDEVDALCLGMGVCYYNRLRCPMFGPLFIVAFGTVSLLKHDNCRRYCIWKFIIPLYTELMKSLTNPRGYI